jgi:hypothetical protein
MEYYIARAKYTKSLKWVCKVPSMIQHFLLVVSFSFWGLDLIEMKFGCKVEKSWKKLKKVENAKKKSWKKLKKVEKSWKKLKKVEKSWTRFKKGVVFGFVSLYIFFKKKKLYSINQKYIRRILLWNVWVSMEIILEMKELDILQMRLKSILASMILILMTESAWPHPLRVGICWYV